MQEQPKIVLDEAVLHAVLGMKSADRRQALRIFQQLQREWW